MSYSAQEIESITATLRKSLGDNITWQFDEKMQTMLSEFAQNKSDGVLENLRVKLTDEWHFKTIKSLPKSLQNQLNDLAKINKVQRILAMPASESSPAILALWWPWDHGGTYSLRLKVLEDSYENTPAPQSNAGIFSKLKGLFTAA